MSDTSWLTGSCGHDKWYDLERRGMICHDTWSDMSTLIESYYKTEQSTQKGIAPRILSFAPFSNSLGCSVLWLSTHYSKQLSAVSWKVHAIYDGSYTRDFTWITKGMYAEWSLWHLRMKLFATFLEKKNVFRCFAYNPPFSKFSESITPGPHPTLPLFVVPPFSYFPIFCKIATRCQPMSEEYAVVTRRPELPGTTHTFSSLIVSRVAFGGNIGKQRVIPYEVEKGHSIWNRLVCRQ